MIWPRVGVVASELEDDFPQVAWAEARELDWSFNGLRGFLGNGDSVWYRDHF